MNSILERIADYLQLGMTTSKTYNGPEFPEEGLQYIRNLNSVLPMVDGRIVYEAMQWTPMKQGLCCYFATNIEGNRIAK